MRRLETPHLCSSWLTRKIRDPSLALRMTARGLWRRRALAPLPFSERDEGVAAPSCFLHGTDRQFDAELKNPSLLDYNRRAFVDHLEQFDHVLVTHPHAAVTRSRSDFVLVFRSMNVNETVARIRIVLVEPIQP
jgi:hypothetical protein